MLLYFPDQLDEIAQQHQEDLKNFIKEQEQKNQKIRGSLEEKLAIRRRRRALQNLEKAQKSALTAAWTTPSSPLSKKPLPWSECFQCYNIGWSEIYFLNGSKVLLGICCKFVQKMVFVVSESIRIWILLYQNKCLLVNTFSSVLYEIIIKRYSYFFVQKKYSDGI